MSLASSSIQIAEDRAQGGPGVVATEAQGGEMAGVGIGMLAVLAGRSRVGLHTSARLMVV